MNYDELREWITSREGQVIVCENSEAEWLDFKPLKNLQGQRRKTVEVVWETDNI